MPRTVWNDREDDALHGLPWAAQLVYLRALRPYMDYATGVVGRHRGISLKGIAETLHVEYGQGRRDAGDPTRKAVRHALVLLERVGLVVRLPADRRLLYQLPLADTDQCVPRKQGRSRADRGHSRSGRGRSPHAAALAATPDPTRAEAMSANRGTPPGSVDPYSFPPGAPLLDDAGATVGEALVGRGTRLSLAELPAAWRNWAARERPDLDLDLTWAVFVDYWRAQPGRQGVRLDWLRTWRNWVRRERRQRGGDERGRRPTGTTGERRAAVAETIRDNLARHDWTTTSPWGETGPTPPCGD